MVFNRRKISEFTATAVESAAFNGVYCFCFSGNGLNIRKPADVSRMDPVLLVGLRCCLTNRLIGTMMPAVLISFPPEVFMETYYQPEDLKKFGEIGKEAPELGRKFFEYYEAVFAEGALTEREKTLIAVAVAHAVQCPYCIDAYTRACLEKGSNLAEMTEAVHVAAAIRAGASLVHGVQMRNVATKLSL